MRSERTKVSRSRNDLHNKSMAGILAAMMLIVMLLSAFYVALHAEHNCVHQGCSEHDCPICACIQQCASILRGIGDDIQQSAVLYIPLLLILITISLTACPYTENTPVSDKVRMND